MTDVLTLNDEGRLLIHYLKIVGTMLKDGHFDRARDDADEARRWFKQLTSAR